MTQIYWFLGSENYQPEQLVEQARAAEAAGFDGVMLSEHFNPWVDDAGAAGFAWSTLGALAVATDRLKFMTSVTAPLWRMHPAVVAQAAATVNRLSGGRFTLGVGSGEKLNEAALGYSYPAYAERAARLEEAVGLMATLLAGGTVTGGQFYPVETAKLYSPPVNTVPILVAADGPKTAALAGRSAAGVITSVKDIATTTKRVVEPVRAAAAEAGGAAPTIAATRWSVRGSDAEAWEALQPLRGLRAPSRNTATNPAVLRREADALPREEILGRYSRVQTAADAVEVYGEVVHGLQPEVLGVCMASVNPVETIGWFGQHVLGELKKL